MPKPMNHRGRTPVSKHTSRTLRNTVRPGYAQRADSIDTPPPGADLPSQSELEHVKPVQEDFTADEEKSLADDN